MKCFPIAAALLRACLTVWCLAAATASTPAPSPATHRLFQLYSDTEQTVPREGQPYRIYLDGSLVDASFTDAQGAVVTAHRRSGQAQEFVMQIFRLGTYSVRFDAAGLQTVDRVAGWEWDDHWKTDCDPSSAPCTGKGFYWIQLQGLGADFTGEPYSLSMGTRRLQGKVGVNGYVFIPHDNPPAVSEPVVLQLCAGPAIRLLIGTAVSGSSAAPVKGPRAAMNAVCKESNLPAYMQRNKPLNGGMPYIFSQWSLGTSPVQAQEIEQATQADALTEYSRLAAANNDPLAWLGPLPTRWDEKLLAVQQRALFDRIQADVSGLSAAHLKQFSCKTPQQVGPTPDAAAVEQFLASFPASARDQALVNGLLGAASKGNWQAVAILYTVRSQQRPSGNIHLFQHRQLQLQQWLHKRKIGSLYRVFDDELIESGYYGGLLGHGLTPHTVYAALHHSYSSQRDVGRKLQDQSEDPELKAVGEAMLRCAEAAMPTPEVSKE